MASKLYNVLNTYKTTILNHINNKSNPHNLTFNSLGIKDYVHYYNNFKDNPTYWAYRKFDGKKVEQVTQKSISISNMETWTNLYYYHPDSIFTSSSTVCKLSSVDFVSINALGTGNFWVCVNSVSISNSQAEIDYYIISTKAYTATVTFKFFVLGTCTS